jgi:hypothetical protein
MRAAKKSQRGTLNLFCIQELPAEVDPARCSAILSNGLLGIRISKTSGEKTAPDKNLSTS